MGAKSDLEGHFEIYETKPSCFTEVTITQQGHQTETQISSCMMNDIYSCLHQEAVYSAKRSKSTPV